MNRGELWSAATGGGYGGKPRPVPIVQAGPLAQATHIIVALCTTFMNEEHIRPRIEPDHVNNLEDASYLQVDVLLTVPRRKFGRRIGYLTSGDLERVDEALASVLGLAG